MGAAALPLRHLGFAPLRWFLEKLYGAIHVLLPIFSGVYLDRKMVLGRRFHIIHPGMVLLHPQATFGDDGGVMHNVTISTNMTGGAPTIGNDVFIGCGAVILGDIKIGDGVHIAANSLVISDVPSGAMAMGVPANVYSGRGHGPAAAEAQRAMTARMNAGAAMVPPPSRCSPISPPHKARKSTYDHPDILSAIPCADHGCRARL